jgi:hypothetical protein
MMAFTRRRARRMLPVSSSERGYWAASAAGLFRGSTPLILISICFIMVIRASDPYIPYRFLLRKEA